MLEDGPATDVVQRFVVEDQAVRGQFVRLDASWGALRSFHTLATTAIAIATTMTINDSQVPISGAQATCSPPLMKGSSFSCRA